MANLVLTLNRAKVPVASIHEAQLAVCELSQSIGGDEFYSRHARSGAVLRQDGKIIGSISYNARWWPKGIPHTEVGPNYLGDLMHVVHNPNPKESTMSKPKAPKKTAPATAAAKEPVIVTSATKKAAAKAAKVKAEKAPKEELCVFAIRLTPAERDAVHAAAGPGKATRFVRALIVAAANRDEAKVATILKGVLDAQAK